ncbi:hypothetical protein IL306_004859 [Fusarium sp. DS 682]|nr:hypothetical protein IL306_004859 [Fusarium sp. DS 682]
MAASAEWNMTRRSVSYDIQGLQDSGELQVRQRRDKHRVWLALGNTDRTPLSTTVVLEHVASRQWMTLTEWTYPLGDGKAVGGHELTGIARNVYESMMRTRVDDGASQSSLDFEAFQKDMDDFNNKISAWGDYWRATFATFPNPEPFQTPLIYLFRDYMRLYFNSVFLHRMLVSENRAALNDLITHTTQICYCSALSILRQGITMGELDIIYYLWDTAHLMIAYSSMMIPKLLRQDIDESLIPKSETVETFTQVTATYVAAAKSMGSSETRTFDPRNNAVAAQAHLLSAILARLKADLSQSDPELIMPENPSGAGLSWIEDQLNRSTLFSDGRMEAQQPEYIDVDAGQTEDMSSFMGQGYEGLDLMLDDDFMNSRYFDVGLLSWDEPGIFIQPH